MSARAVYDEPFKRIMPAVSVLIHSRAFFIEREFLLRRLLVAVDSPCADAFRLVRAVLYNAVDILGRVAEKPTYFMREGLLRIDSSDELGDAFVRVSDRISLFGENGERLCVF